MKRVYVAGAISADHHFAFLRNVGRGIQYGIKLLLLGFAPFIPHLDFLLVFQATDSETKELVKDGVFYSYSMAWLEASQAVFVLPNSENSKGTQKEIERARELGIPIFDNIPALVMWGQNER